ncbi:hypothetical protein BE08_23865 [Sorangium cellulosum]|uniref:Uncharacterized protein n=1 Tax=Sorangium cellulosum TaxID=56 RepID=A0A150P748_SORCE|nr:hypothetical protein BE08_23865 [Sorangium cellulosum]
MLPRDQSAVVAFCLCVRMSFRMAFVRRFPLGPSHASYLKAHFDERGVEDLLNCPISSPWIGQRTLDDVDLEIALCELVGCREPCDSGAVHEDRGAASVHRRLDRTYSPFSWNTSITPFREAFGCIPFIVRLLVEV